MPREIHGPNHTVVGNADLRAGKPRPLDRQRVLHELVKGRKVALEVVGNRFTEEFEEMAEAPGHVVGKRLERLQNVKPDSEAVDGEFLEVIFLQFVHLGLRVLHALGPRVPYEAQDQSAFGKDGWELRQLVNVVDWCAIFFKR